MEGKKIIIFYYSYSTMSTEKLIKGVQAAFPNIEILLLPNEEKNDVSSYESELEKIFNEQLKRLDMDYIDIYLLHGLDAPSWKMVDEFHVFDFVERKKREGKIGHIGFSYHDDYDTFSEIISAYPWDLCQIQLNYVDENFQAGVKGLEYAREHNVPVVIMEPVKGGLLAKEYAGDWDMFSTKMDPVDYAFSWVADKEGILTILSGMSSREQVEHNINLFDRLAPGCVPEEDKKVYRYLAASFKGLAKYECTGCEYCMPCAAGIDIPTVIDLTNQLKLYDNSPETFALYDREDKKASDCIDCKACESVCPQGLPVSDIMKLAVKGFE